MAARGVLGPCLEVILCTQVGMKRKWKLQFQGQGGAETSIDIPHLMVALPHLGLPGGCVDGGKRMTEDC